MKMLYILLRHYVDYVETHGHVKIGHYGAHSQLRDYDYGTMTLGIGTMTIDQPCHCI